MSPGSTEASFDLAVPPLLEIGGSDLLLPYIERLQSGETKALIQPCRSYNLQPRALFWRR